MERERCCGETSPCPRRLAGEEPPSLKGPPRGLLEPKAVVCISGFGPCHSLALDRFSRVSWSCLYCVPALKRPGHLRCRNKGRKKNRCAKTPPVCREAGGGQEGGAAGTEEFPGAPQCGTFAFRSDSTITQKTVRLTPIVS